MILCARNTTDSRNWWLPKEPEDTVDVVRAISVLAVVYWDRENLRDHYKI